MRVFPVVVLSFALSSACAAAELALPAPGTARPEVAGLDDFTCEVEPRISRCRLKSGLAKTFAGAPVEAALLDIRESRVVVAAVFIDEAAFVGVVERLTADFGAAEDHSEQLRGGMGGTFTNVVKAWRRDGTIWFAEQFAGRINRSAVSRVGTAEFDGMMAARAAQRVNGARNL